MFFFFIVSQTFENKADIISKKRTKGVDNAYQNVYNIYGGTNEKGGIAKKI